MKNNKLTTDLPPNYVALNDETCKQLMEVAFPKKVIEEYNRRYAGTDIVPIRFFVAFNSTDNLEFFKENGII